MIIYICGFISSLRSQNKRTVLASAFEVKLEFWRQATKSQDKFLSTELISTVFIFIYRWIFKCQKYALLERTFFPVCVLRNKKRENFNDLTITTVR